MANKQRSQFRTTLKYRGGNRSELTNALLDGWLDAGLLDLAGKIRIRQFETTVASNLVIGSDQLAFPTDWIVILDIRNTTKDRPMSFIEWPRLRKMSIKSGDPRLWSVYGTTIYFDKLAATNDALSLWGVKMTPWGTADNATPGVDDQLQYGIELLAAAHMFRDIGDTEKAALIDNPLQPGTGEFWVWAKTNRIPQLQQGLATRPRSHVNVAMGGYSIVE